MNFLLFEPFPVASDVNLQPFIIVAIGVKAEQRRVSTVANPLYLGLLAVPPKWQLKFTVSQSVSLPKDNLRFNLLVRQYTLLKASDQTSVWHYASWEF